MTTTTGQPDAAITRMSLRFGAPSRSLMGQHAALMSPVEYVLNVGQTGRPTVNRSDLVDVPFRAAS